jgi:hypothetical protein
MALVPTVLFDAFILINATNVSDHGNKIELPISADEEDTTAFGQTWKARTGALKDASVNIDFINDFVAAGLDATMFALLGTVVTFEVRPTSAARSTANAAYTGSIFIKEWKPIVGNVGKLVISSVSFPTSGPVLRQTS